MAAPNPPFNVRVFAYRGIREIAQVLPKQFSADSVKVNAEPALSRQIINVAASGQAYESVPDANDAPATCAVIEVPDGYAVRYVVNPLGPSGSGHVNAASVDRKMTGTQIVEWGAGYSISVIDASTLP